MQQRGLDFRYFLTRYGRGAPQGHYKDVPWTVSLFFIVSMFPTLAVSGSPEYNQPRPLIEVRCDIESTALVNYYTGRLDKVRTEMCQKIVEMLSDHWMFSLWDYTTVRSKDGIDLVVSAVDRLLGAEIYFQVTMIDQNSGWREKPMMKLWRRAGERKRDPPRTGGGEIIAESVMELLQDRQGGVADFLRRIPLALGGKWINLAGRWRILTCLPYERYRRLSDTELDVVFDDGASAKVTGLAKAQEYQSLNCDERVLALRVIRLIKLGAIRILGSDAGSQGAQPIVYQRSDLLPEHQLSTILSQKHPDRILLAGNITPPGWSKLE